MNTEFTLEKWRLSDKQRVSSNEPYNKIARPLARKSNATSSWVSRGSMNSSVNVLNCSTCAICGGTEIPITTSPISLSHSTNLRSLRRLCAVMEKLRYLRWLLENLSVNTGLPLTAAKDSIYTAKYFVPKALNVIPGTSKKQSMAKTCNLIPHNVITLQSY
jgi:hypothetical protein